MWRTGTLLPVAYSPRLAILVELAIQMYVLQDELNCGGRAGGIALCVELADRGPQAAHLGHLLHVLHGGHHVPGIGPEAALEVRQQLIELLQQEVSVEYV